MGELYSTHERSETFVHRIILVGRPEGKRPFGKT
jgi:hypothetical protein